MKRQCSSTLFRQAFRDVSGHSSFVKGLTVWVTVRSPKPAIIAAQGNGVVAVWTNRSVALAPLRTWLTICNHFIRPARRETVELRPRLLAVWHRRDIITFRLPTPLGRREFILPASLDRRLVQWSPRSGSKRQ